MSAQQTIIKSITYRGLTFDITHNVAYNQQYYLAYLQHSNAVKASSNHNNDTTNASWRQRIDRYCNTDYVYLYFPENRARIWFSAINVDYDNYRTATSQEPYEPDKEYIANALQEIEQDITTILQEINRLTSDPLDLRDYYNTLSELEHQVIERYTQTQKQIETALQWQPAILSIVKDIDRELEQLRYTANSIRKDLDEAITDDTEWLEYYQDQHRQELQSHQETMSRIATDMGRRLEEQLAYHRAFIKDEIQESRDQIVYDLTMSFQEDGFTKQNVHDLTQLMIDDIKETPLYRVPVEVTSDITRAVRSALSTEIPQGIYSALDDYGVIRSLAYMIGGWMAGNFIASQKNVDKVLGFLFKDKSSTIAQQFGGQLLWAIQWAGRSVAYETAQRMFTPETSMPRSTQDNPIYWKYEFWGTKKHFNIPFYDLSQHAYNYKASTLGIRNLIRSKGGTLQQIGFYSKYH